LLNGYFKLSKQINFNFCRRVNPNTKGQDGWSALEIAATSGVLEIIQILL